MNASKAKGTLFETAVVTYLRNHGFPWAERRALTGGRDRGDIAGIPGVVIECKAEKLIDLAGYMAEVGEEVENEKYRYAPGQEPPTYGVAVVKRRQRPVDQSYVVMTLATFAELIADT